MRSLNDFVESHTSKGYATKANAEKKLASVLKRWTETQASTVCVQRSDGRWFPVVINAEMAIAFYAHNGIIVWR